MKKFSALLLAAVMGSAITVGTLKFVEDDKDSLKIEYSENIPAVPVVYDENGNATPVDFTASAEKTMPAVVHIRSVQTSVTSNRQNQIPEQFREFFRPFMEPDGNQPRMGSGSGVIINREGFIVTNNHVIDNADDISVTLNDNQTYTAKVIGTDPTTDLALIKIDADESLSFLALSDSDELRIGEWVLAIGNPFNLTSTVTAGIVSAKGRNINILNTANPGDSVNMAIESFIQTDAAINPGNSGGALVNIFGDLVGINTAIASPTGAYSGYGFAVPSNIVKRVVEDLMMYGTVQRGMMGVQITSVNSEIADRFDLDVVRGAYVSGVQPNTAAAAAGVKQGDVIVEIDNQTINSSAELIGYVGGKRPGDKISVTVNRDGKELDYEMVLRNRQGTTEMIRKEVPELLTSLGMELAEVPESTLKEMDLSGGVQVSRLNAGKVRSETDIREGFIITHIDGKRVSDPKDVVGLLEGKSGGVLIEGRYEGSSKVYYYGLGM